MREAVRLLVLAVALLLPLLLGAAPPPARAVSPDVVLSMQVNPATGDPNDVITYTIWLDDLGPQDARSMWVNDTLPLGAAYIDDTAATDIPPPIFVGRSVAGNVIGIQFANYPAGNTSFQLRARIGLAVADRQVLTNSVQLWYTNAGGVPQPPATVTRQTTVAIPVITVSKSGAFTAPATIVYSITISNSGSASARNLWWNDTLPPGTTYSRFVGSLLNAACTPAGRWVNCTMVVPFAQTLRTWSLEARIPAPLPPASTIVNWVSVNYTDSDGTLLGQRSASAPLAVETARITVAKVSDASRTPPAGTIGYTIFYNNTGQLDASIVWINDTLPRNSGLPA